MISSEPRNEHPLVLVVDDDESTRLLTRASLEPHGFRVAEAPDGETALALCQQITPELVLLDVLMPGMDGFQTCAALRRLPRGEAPAIVMMTGLEDLDSIIRAFQEGATDFIIKPINWTLLNYRLRFILMATRALQQQRLLEEQLHESQKMEALGRLAGGVAHDFNNLLTVITGCTELLLTGLPQSEAFETIRAELEDIQQAAEHASSLIGQLLAFSRRQVLRPRILDLKELVVHMEKMLSRIIGEDIEVVTVFTPDPAIVLADQGQLEQVIMNLAVNARDAMPQGGRLTLTVTGNTLDENFCRWHPEARPGPYVRLTVSDTGVGMDEATLARAFEPFFTTKEPGLGTGLGLSTVHGIVKQSGGFIQVTSKPGQGTTFELYLPQALEEMEPREPGPCPSDKVLAGMETILLVEDDPLVRRVASKILRIHGYAVLEAGSGREALSLATRHPGSIDLLLTDLVMPDMHGRDLAERWQELHPESRILFTSGYADSIPGEAQCPFLSGTSFIPKPYRLHALARKVREVLAAVPFRGTGPFAD